MSGVSTMARALRPGTTLTEVTPRNLRKSPAGTFIGPGDGRGAGRRLRERRRARGVEGDVALDLLHDLVDVAVEHGHRAEPLQVGERLRAVVRAPAPLRIDGPQRDVGEHHDRRARREPRHVVLEPLELLGAEVAEPAGLEVDDVDEADEVHAVAGRSCTSRRRASRCRSARGRPCRCPRRARRARPGRRTPARPASLMSWSASSNSSAFERWLMSPVWIMKAGCAGSALILAIASRSVAERVRVGRLVEADVAVADLQEGEGRGAPRRRPARWPRPIDRGTPPRQRPEDAGAGPGHAFEKAAPVDAVVRVGAVVRGVVVCHQGPPDESGPSGRPLDPAPARIIPGRSLDSAVRRSEKRSCAATERRVHGSRDAGGACSHRTCGSSSHLEGVPLARRSGSAAACPPANRRMRSTSRRDPGRAPRAAATSGKSRFRLARA